MRSTKLAVLVAALALGVHPATRAQTAKAGAATPQAHTLPPISYTCPMHREILEDAKGTCPHCKMSLVPVRLDSVWTCATRPLAVVSGGPGRCPIDGTPLVQVTAAVSWRCPQGGEESVSPGTCPGGAPMQKTYASRAHGNHNPQHGGLFFMAADNTHHLEGVYLPAGVFRLHLYDEFTMPLATVKSVQATLTVKDSRTGKNAAFSLERTGRHLEAAIGKRPLPAEMFANVTFTSGGKDNRFDFTFPEYSKDPHAPSAATMTNVAPAPAAASEGPSEIDAALVPLPIPDTVSEMLAQLTTRSDQIRWFIDKGAFAAIYVPAFQAKDLALALDGHTNELTFERRKAAEPAIATLVRSAYLLDAVGDIGNKQQISWAYATFVEAAHDLRSAFAP